MTIWSIFGDKMIELRYSDSESVIYLFIYLFFNQGKLSNRLIRLLKPSIDDANVEPFKPYTKDSWTAKLQIGELWERNSESLECVRVSLSRVKTVNVTECCFIQ